MKNTNEMREMLKAEISNWIDERCSGISKTCKKAAINEILGYYEEIQEWNEDIMTSGASVDEINDWLTNDPTAENTLETYYYNSMLDYERIMCGLGFEQIAITDAFDTCIATIKSVKEYAEKHSYEDDLKLLDITYDGKSIEKCFVDMVKDFVDYSYENELYDNRTSFTNRIIACCYNRASSLLENTRLCEELGVTFGEYASSYASVCNWQLECDEGTYEDFEDNIGDIFDRLSSAKQEKQSKNNKPIERD